MAGEGRTPWWAGGGVGLLGRGLRWCAGACDRKKKGEMAVGLYVLVDVEKRGLGLHAQARKKAALFNLLARR